jgi:molybdate transport system ATP-binding protein
MSQGVVPSFRIERSDFSLDVDLNLPGRGVTALFGHSGSGKTTCLRAMAGLERAPGGYFAVGDEVWQDEARGLSCRPTVARWASSSRKPACSRTCRCAEIWNSAKKEGATVAFGASLPEMAELLGIGHLLDRSPGQLSGGERSASPSPAPCSPRRKSC